MQSEPVTAGAAVAVGTFDGVHLGHREVVAKLRAEASARRLRPMVVTFDPHPLEVIAPRRAPRLLQSVERRVEALRGLGVDVEVLRFSESLRCVTAKEWIETLRDKYGTRLLVVGYDNTFGCDGMNMSVGDYAALGADAGVEVVAAPVLEGVSSSLIRAALSRGDVENARKMLGSAFEIEGIVVPGRMLGRQLGFPTANIQADRRLLIPYPGVYAADVSLDDSRHRAVVNIGTAPTVADGLPLTIEAHLLNFEGDLYGSNARVVFLSRIRPERKFASLEELRRQIAADAELAKNAAIL